MHHTEQAAPRLRSSAMKEQLLEYFEVHLSTVKYVVAYFFWRKRTKCLWAAGTADKQSVKSGLSPAKRNKWRGPT